ncbi:MAG: ATP-binding cassette domain-containing protein, partial [Pseudolysinimonas sp.]
MLRADGISHAYGDRAILTDLSLTVSAGQRIGPLGENGAGKSTLLRLLAGVEPADSGVVARPERTALLTQEVAAGPATSIRALIDAATAHVRAIESTLADAAAELAGDDPSAADRYAAALEAAEAAGLWSLDARRDEL